MIDTTCLFGVVHADDVRVVACAAAVVDCGRPDLPLTEADVSRCQDRRMCEKECVGGRGDGGGSEEREGGLRGGALCAAGWVVRASCATTPKSQPHSPKLLVRIGIGEGQVCLFGSVETRKGAPTTTDENPSLMRLFEAKP